MLTGGRRVAVVHARAGEPIRLVWPDGAGGRDEIVLTRAQCLALIEDLARACAAEGALRLGILHLDGAPIAAQIWIVWSGKATLYKLAHDRRHDRLSPGTVLTMHMIERVIDVDRAAEVDFGVGDDPYKRRWASARRERWGLMAFEPRTARGMIGILRHVVGRKVKRLTSAYVSPGPRS